MLRTTGRDHNKIALPAIFAASAALKRCKPC